MSKLPCPACEGSGWIPKQSRRHLMFNFRTGKHWYAFKTVVRGICPTCNRLGRVTLEVSSDWQLRKAPTIFEAPVDKGKAKS